MLKEEEVRKKIKHLKRFYMDLINFVVVNAILILAKICYPYLGYTISVQSLSHGCCFHALPSHSISKSRLGRKKSQRIITKAKWSL